MEEFTKIKLHDADFRAVLAKMKNYKKELDEGREECYAKILAELYKSDNKGENPILLRKFNDLSLEK